MVASVSTQRGTSGTDSYVGVMETLFSRVPMPYIQFVHD